MQRRCLFTTLLFAGLTYALFSGIAFAADKIHDIKIARYDISEKLCEEMKTFKASHVKEFFTKAKKINGIERHDFDEFNCHISGTLKRGSKLYEFDIQPIGLGTLIEKPSGRADWYGCKSCDRLFPPPEH